MAEALVISSFGGYDDEFVEVVEDDLLCPICHLPLKRPVQTESCGHRFCRQCIDRHFTSQERNRQPLTCPMDQTLSRQQDIFSDRATERKILSLIIKCPSKGCQWTGELRAKNTHLTHCPHEVVSCTNDGCRATLPRRALQEHLTSTCDHRIICCSYCDTSHHAFSTEVHIFLSIVEWSLSRSVPALSFKFFFRCTVICTGNHMISSAISIIIMLFDSLLLSGVLLGTVLLCLSATPQQLSATGEQFQEWPILVHFQGSQSHRSVCGKFPVDCPNACGSREMRERIPDHVENQCTLTVISCPYSNLGCSSKFQRRERESHLQSYMRLHLDLACVRRESDGQQLKCPLDNNFLDRDKDIFPDKATQRKILSFIIHCPRDGCQWTGELRAKEVHENDCQRFPVNCPNGCEEFIPRDEIFLHTQDKCPLAASSCPYADMGCTKKVTRQDDIDSHIESEMRLHLDLVGVKLRDTEEELQKFRNEEEELQKLRNQKEELQKLRNKEQLEKLRDTQEELRNTKQLVKKLQERINALENKPCVYLWKIRGFRELLRQARAGYKDEIKSAPFYTSEFGYKVRMSLYPNGNGEGKNTYLSIFIHIMKGDYDSVLEWPFRKRITFTLIDQKENPDDRDNISSTLEKEGRDDWNSRPKEKENGVSMGFHKFVSHDKLMKSGCILDDTIFIEARFV
ncbi:TNF receptor-associated factor 4-like [Montipora capricornis]|uniref:TNF receptor-associated factor 4-like n=1 Tax=Montipora capricornis TaxID=246305 RepID=UPI0035F12862